MDTSDLLKEELTFAKITWLHAHYYIQFAKKLNILFYLLLDVMKSLSKYLQESKDAFDVYFLPNKIVLTKIKQSRRKMR